MADSNLSETVDRTITEPLFRPLEGLRDHVVKMVEQRSTDNRAELNVLRNNVKTTIGVLRQRIKEAKDVSRSGQYLSDKIKDLNRQIKLKDEYFNNFKTKTRQSADLDSQSMDLTVKAPSTDFA